MGFGPSVSDFSSVAALPASEVVDQHLLPNSLKKFGPLTSTDLFFAELFHRVPLKLFFTAWLAC